MILGLILATSLFLISVGSHLVILNAGHTLLEQNCSLLHKLGKSWQNDQQDAAQNAAKP